MSSNHPEKDLVAGLPTEELEIEEELGNALMEILPGDGSTIGNQAARQALSEQVGREIDEVAYSAVKERLLGMGVVRSGRGAGAG